MPFLWGEWSAFYLDNELTFVAKADSGPAHRAPPPPLEKKIGVVFVNFYNPKFYRAVIAPPDFGIPGSAPAKCENFDGD